MNGKSNTSLDEKPPMRLTWYNNEIRGARGGQSDLDGDQLSCVQFDGSGNFLAVGDRGGKITVYRTLQETTKNNNPIYETYCTFTSHESEFDYLKSLEIEEKINKIRWLPQKNQSRHLLSTNDKTIKLWRLTERNKRVTGFNLPNDDSNINYSGAFDETEGDEDDHLTTMVRSSMQNGNGFSSEARRTQQSRFIQSSGDLRVPHYEQSTSMLVEAQPRRIFSNAHAYHINSISVNSDQETFLSSDDLRVNLWNLDITDQSFNIVDIKPVNMEELSEVITGAEFHPTSCSLFMYSSSKGILRLCDMRERALCDKCSLTFQEPDLPTNRGFFSEIINSITDFKFSSSGRLVLSRDYLTLKVWDLNMPREPLEIYQVHEHFRRNFVALYENDSIFDKFECAWSPDNQYLMTGSYHNLFRIFDRSTGRGVFTEVSREPDLVPLSTRDITTDPVPRCSDQICVDSINLNKKLLYMSWHPSQARVAVTSTDNLFMASAKTED